MQVLDYAKYLGIDTEEDADLVFVAKFAMTAEVPPGWMAYLDDEGNEYFNNAETGACQYEHPMDEQYKQMYQELREKKRLGRLFSKQDKSPLSSARRMTMPRGFSQRAPVS